MEKKEKKVTWNEVKFLIGLWLQSPRATVALAIFCALNVTVPIIESFLRIPMLSKIIEDPTDLQPKLINLGLIFLLIIVLDTMRPRYYKKAGIYVFIDTLNRFTEKVMNTDVSNIDDTTPATLQTTTDLVNDVADVGQMAGAIIMAVAYVFSTIIALRNYLDHELWFIISAYVAIAVILSILSKKIREIAKENEKIKRSRNKELENTVNGFSEVRIFNRVQSHIDSIREKNTGIGNGIMKKNHWIQGMYLSFNVLDMGGVLLIIALSASKRLDGTMSVASLIAVVQLLGQLIQPMDTFIDVLEKIQEAVGKMPTLREIFEWEDPRPDGQIQLGSWNEIRFDDVSFHYPKNTDNALNHLSLVIHPGEKIGICGSKGVGKSTLGKLLLRFYRPQSGTITIDGIGIDEFSRDSYTRIFGAVQQDNTIFKGTIRNNLVYGNPSADEVTLVEACRKAGIYSFIQSLEKGFDTDAGLNGRKLSGGQRQCIAIARMLIRNPNVIILDEATSALDNESERMVQKAIQNIGTEKTVISIAHRLTTLKNCDKIIVMGKNGILESGTHKELLEKKGEYFRLWNAGMKDE